MAEAGNLILRMEIDPAQSEALEQAVRNFRENVKNLEESITNVRKALTDLELRAVVTPEKKYAEMPSWPGHTEE